MYRFGIKKYVQSHRRCVGILTALAAQVAEDCKELVEAIHDAGEFTLPGQFPKASDAQVLETVARTDGRADGKQEGLRGARPPNSKNKTKKSKK